MGGVNRPNLKFSGRNHRQCLGWGRIRPRWHPLPLLRCSPTYTLPESPPTPNRSQGPQGALGGHSAGIPRHPRTVGTHNRSSSYQCPGIGGSGCLLPVALRIGPGSSCGSPWGGLQLKKSYHRSEGFEQGVDVFHQAILTCGDAVPSYLFSIAAGVGVLVSLPLATQSGDLGDGSTLTTAGGV